MSVSLVSSTVMTLTLPNVLAIKSPITTSLLAEIDAICFIFSEELPTYYFALKDQQLYL